MIDFERTLGLLGGEGVRFVIVGGLAVTIHGSAHVTFDLDICSENEYVEERAILIAFGHTNPETCS